MKRRKLEPQQEVIVIYDVNIGFVQEPASFVEYASLKVGDNLHSVPVFKYRDKEITGLECFWILPSDARTPEAVHRLQYELIPTQLVVTQVAEKMGYNIPTKIKDKELTKMASEKTEQRAALIKKFGFDPTDDSWLEADLAQSTREKKWFKFERENRLIFNDNWDEIISKYNKAYQDNLTVDEAKALSKKRMRYILGAHNLRYRGDKDKKRWAAEARDFERMHRDRESRMVSWTAKHKNHFPLVRTKKPVRFFTGPYFNECIEKAPSVFEDTSCQAVKAGIVLRVISYDPQDKYIRLDFTEDIRKLIKGEESDPQPWIRDSLDYDFWVKPPEVETHLEFIESVE